MKYETINRRYFMWIYHRVIDDSLVKGTYYRLLHLLHEKTFRYSIAMDMNREEDGLDLRYRFADETETDKRIAASVLDSRPCTVLEMMAALAIRLEEQIMAAPGKNDRTCIWFVAMLDNLGLNVMDDENFDEQESDMIIERFLDRDYERDGRGSLFYIPDCNTDMRNIEIWYQMNRYINEVIEMEDTEDV